MKVGIFTFPNSRSFGATLQMYALYRAVQKLGYDVEIINYQNEYMKLEKHITSASQSASLSKKVKRVISKLCHLPQQRAFISFEKSMMKKHPAHVISDTKTLTEVARRYGAVICGSDQVWNPDITGNDINYFLSFCGQNTKRIAYAPSFGVEEISHELASAISVEMEKFSALSVRERAGRVLAQRLIGRDLPLVTDPTLLLSQDEWTSIEKAHPMAKGDYILYYTIRSSQSLWHWCKELSAKTGLKVIIVGGNIVKRISNSDPMVDYACDLSPQEWLALVHNARYVVTNSFHGSAFSIIFHKDFYLQYSSLTNSRLEQIVELAGLEDRVLKDGNHISPSSIDYVRVEEKLSAMRSMSASYLKGALDKAVSHG